MLLIPVLDLSQGVAVQAIAGDRASYAPVASMLTPGVVGDPLALIQAYRDTVLARECYLADLDAIQGGAVQRRSITDLARSAAPTSLMVDAGVGGADRALELLALGAGRVVVGLETLRDFAALAAIVAAAGPERVVFSLDLRLGRPVLHPANQGAGSDPHPVDLASRAVGAGVKALLLLDLGRVGTRVGVDLGLLERLRRRFPSEQLLSGGGIRGREDLERVREAGCDAVLVATALHSGRVGSGDLQALAGESSGQSSARSSR